MRRSLIKPLGKPAPVMLALLLQFGCLAGHAADTLNWDASQNRVSADIKSEKLHPLLERIAAASGWRVFVEPGLQGSVSAKFQHLPPGEALHLLLGDISFALVPETNRSPRLLVFRTTAQRATELIPLPVKGKIIPNQLIVRLKPGARIDDIARMLGAKVTGKIAGLNAYRLQFDDPAATAAALQQLAANPQVASVENNYVIDAPPPPSQTAAAPLPGPPHLELTPPPANGRIVIGLVDTAIQQPLGNGLDAFILKPISVAGTPDPDPDAPTHATTMAETMLSSMQDVTKGASSVQILPVDVFGPNPSSSSFDIAEGIARAVNGGANIINLSLGSEENSSILQTVIQDAQAKNIVFIGAAGNSGTTSPFYPAAFPGVNSVTAVDNGQLPSYADRGSWVSYGAPGTSIIYFNNQPWSVVGTSASAAYVSGALAGYLDSTHSGLDQAQAFIRSNFSISAPPVR
ncbi:MAG: S8 family peptidase [Limisphaerales bacterium]